MSIDQNKNNLRTFPLQNQNLVKGKSVPLKTSFERSVYDRMSNYCKNKGVDHQEVIRFAVALFLDKSGY